MTEIKKVFQIEVKGQTQFTNLKGSLSFDSLHFKIKLLLKM